MHNAAGRPSTPFNRSGVWIASPAVASAPVGVLISWYRGPLRDGCRLVWTMVARMKKDVCSRYDEASDSFTRISTTGGGSTGLRSTSRQRGDDPSITVSTHSYRSPPCRNTNVLSGAVATRSARRCCWSTKRPEHTPSSKATHGLLPSRLSGPDLEGPASVGPATMKSCVTSMASRPLSHHCTVCRL